MSTTLHTLKANPGANKGKKRLGRGHGSGLHKTSGKGMKGQKARTGHHGIPKPGFEGGQTMLARRLPKRGFNNARFQKDIAVVNIGEVAEHFAANAIIGPDQLKDAGFVPRSAEYVKVLGSGDVKKALQVTAHYFSTSAREKITAAKGSVQTIAQPSKFVGKAGLAKAAKAAKKKSSSSAENPA